MLMMGYVGLDLWMHPIDPQTTAADGEGDVEPGENGAEGADEDNGPNGSDGAGSSNGDNDAQGADNKPTDGSGSSGDNGTKNGEEAEPAQPGEDPGEGAFTAPGPQHPTTWATLGAFDGSQGPAAITVSSLGAGIVRWDLVERNAKGRLRYNDIDVKGGYLGVSAWTRSPDGCEVQAIIPGSPADGVLEIGDEVREIAKQPVSTIEALDAQLAKHDAGKTLELSVHRGGATSAVNVTLASRPLALIRPEKTKSGLLANNPPSFLVSLASVNGETVPTTNQRMAPLARLRDDNWELVEADERQVVMRYVLPAKSLAPLVGEEAAVSDLEFTKRFQLVEPAAAPTVEGEDGESSSPVLLTHHIRFSVEVKHLGESPYDVQLWIEGPNGVTSEGWWYQNKMHPKMFKAAGARDVVLQSPSAGRLFRGAGEIFGTARKRPKSPFEPFFDPAATDDERTINFLAMDTQYFAVAMMGAKPTERYLLAEAEPRMIGEVEDIDRKRIKTVNTTFAVQTPAFKTGSEEASLTHSIFGGPKRNDLLDAYKIQELQEYGWFWFVARPLALVLHALYAVVRNYGLAIVLLTVLVRWAMLPLGRKAARNALMMQQLAPEMSQIKERYKGDMQKQAEAQKELYAKYNFNPLSGCLPMFFQLPIFLGLYRCLSVDINLRQAALIPGVDWCSNLAAPDQLWNWSDLLPAVLASETGWLGPYLNILPIFTIGLFLTQQKLFTPPAQDEQQEMQQKIMMYMMVFIGVMFFKVPAGLCLYFITSSIWGIMERKLLPKPELKDTGRPSAGGGKDGEGEKGMEPSKAAIVKRERAKQRRRNRKN